MTRDYTNFMNMTPAELAAYARDHYRDTYSEDKQPLLLALAHQLETEAAVADGLAADLDETQRQLDQWREECRALQRQLDQVRT